MRCKGVFSLLVGLNLRVQCGVYLCPRTHCCGIVVISQCIILLAGFIFECFFAPSYICVLFRFFFEIVILMCCTINVFV